MSTATTNPTSTNGWDTVYAIYFPDMNQAIVNQKTSPASFTQTTQSDDGTYTYAGTFGDWQLTAGGDGENVHLSVPIPSSTWTPGTNPAVHLTAITVVLEVNLAWVSGGATPASGTSNQLKVNSSQPQTVSVLSTQTDWGTNNVDPITQGGIIELLSLWFPANIADFQHVFSTVDLNTVLAGDNTGFQWVVPTSNPLYAVVDQGNSDDNSDITNSIFAVLCMTEGRVSPGVHEIDPYAIPAGVNSAFLISPARVVTNMLLIGMPVMFKDSPALSSFNVTDTSITNNVQLQFADQQLKDGKTVQPKIDSGNFILELMGNLVQMTMNGLHFEYSPGITVSIDHTSTVSLTVNTKRQFKMDVVGTPTTSANISSSVGVLVAEIVGSIAASIIGAAVGGFLGGLASGGTTAIADGGTNAVVNGITTTVEESAENAVSNITADAMADAAATTAGQAGKFATFIAANWAKMLGGFIGAAIGGSTSAISSIVQLMAKENDGEIPTLDNFGTQVMTPITWPDMTAEGFTLVNGSLNGPLQIGVNVNFDHGTAAATSTKQVAAKPAMATA